jgi:MFS family permease
LTHIDTHKETSYRSQKSWLTLTVLGIGLASLCSDLSHEMATTILPLFIAGQIAASPFALGLIEGISDGLASYFKFLGGWWTDRTGKPVAVAGYTLTALATSSFALATNWFTVLLCRSLAWAARGGRSEARNALMADAVDKTHYGKAYGFERSMDTVGAVLAPLIALGLVALGVCYRHIFGVALIPGLLAAMAMAFLVLETKRRPRPDSRLFGDLRKLPVGFRYYILTVGVFGLGQFAPTLLILRASQLLSSSHNAVVSSQLAIGLYVLFNVVQAGSAFLVGSLSNRVGSIPLLAASYAAFAATALGFVFANGQLSILAGLFALAGLAVGGIEAMEPTNAAELLPADYRGTGFGALGAANGLGDFLSSTLVGALWTAYGAGAGFGLAAAFNLLSIALLLLLKRFFRRCTTGTRKNKNADELIPTSC